MKTWKLKFNLHFNLVKSIDSKHNILNECNGKVGIKQDPSMPNAALRLFG